VAQRLSGSDVTLSIVCMDSTPGCTPWGLGLGVCDFSRISLGPQFESRSGRVSFDESLPACHSIGSVTCLTVGDSSREIKLL
jgi:hypothetical protein